MAFLGIGLAALVAIAVASVMWVRTPAYKVLFANLSDKDGGSVVAALAQLNVPYTYAEGGGAILVPANQVHDARLKLASQGLPRGGTVGFELMENQRFGITQFQERLNFQRGLEGELARSIMALPVVQSARIHLALPAQNGFMRDQQKPSASVLLNLHPGRVLDRAQVAGIVHLVASSIPELSPRQVSIIDQTGALLSANGESGNTGMDPGQLNYIRQIETGHIARILAILEPVYGRDNVRAQVTADVDFTQSEQTAEQYRPNQGTEAAAIRSIQTIDAKDGSGQAAQGVPGAMSNQPPSPANAPANGAAQAPQAAGQAGAQAAGNGRREATTNYEVDKTIKVTRAGSGMIKRLTAAVVVNHKKVTAPDGKVTYVALPAPELENVNALVREAIGFAKDRGDSINVVNAPFSREDAAKEVAVPLWKQPEVIDMGKEGARYLGLLMLALIVIFTVIRPSLKALTAPPVVPPPRLNETVKDDLALPAPDGGTGAAVPGLPNPNEAILKLARDNPAAVANVVRGWVGNGA
ncbi:MAG: flagellar basal-body MS-ring/collar protein FliF [Burkholderiales bacterium]|nr:flagellar basal-body MS-ring/collar protein FliF [Burkholderiales bacterium]